MAKRGKLIGLMTCPTCRFPDMEVRLDKNGNPYAFCPDCTQQMLTHGGRRGELMRENMRPLPSEDEPAEPEPEPVAEASPEPEPEPEPEPAAADSVSVTEETPRRKPTTLMG